MEQIIYWEPLEERRTKARITILYGIVHNLVDIPVSDHLAQAPTSRRAGGFKFHAPYTRTLGEPACFLHWYCRSVEQPAQWCSGSSESWSLQRSTRQNVTSWGQLQILIYSHLLYSMRSVLTRACWRLPLYTRYVMFYFRTLYLSEEVGWV